MKSIMAILLLLSLSLFGTEVDSNKKMWVMENVNIGDRWNLPDVVDKLGSFEQLTVKNRNPNIIKAFYFPEADMTIFVNTLKNKIATWRTGKASSL